MRTTVVANRKKHALQSEVRKHVEAGSALYTDDLNSYKGLNEIRSIGVVDHAVQYVDGNDPHERLGELLVRCSSVGLNGTYVSVEPFHLFRYLDEQAYRYNNRKDDDGNPLRDFHRFKQAMTLRSLASGSPGTP